MSVADKERWLELLEEKGGRITGPRRAIVELMANSDRALSPVHVFDLARAKYPKMGLVTVYRTLEILSELGLVERVHQPDGCHMYLRAANGHEHLMICSGCGKAVYFSGDDLSAFIEKISKESGFLIQSHWLQLHGLCKECH
ncbi:MAG: transcriptional repressor [Chloroflexi bacterium HGW-Chloroflexi-5]|jgi:Fe2+ or Zn2+ uptake regulation protein|nr:MAG: transcriptional repressor [Chloroflexi bacterium HGW-Chloroflexi-5]